MEIDTPKGDQVVDLLVPSPTSTFRPVEHGGRAFDGVPGLALALAGQPIVHRVTVVAPDETELKFEVRTPSVELAVVLKANATRSRMVDKDLIDLHNLLNIAQQCDREDIGGWRLDSPGITGARLDAVRALRIALNMSQVVRTTRRLGAHPDSFDQLVQQLILSREHGNFPGNTTM